MDSVSIQVARIIGNQVAYVYAFRRTDDGWEEACAACVGDGCEACGWTGEQPEVAT